MKVDNPYALIALIITAFTNVVMIIYLNKDKKKNQLMKVFKYVVELLLIWCIGMILQITLSDKLNIQKIYFDYFVYIPICFVPITVFFLGLIYEKTKIAFKKKYLLLFIVPLITLLVLWTNDFHHLFYKQYSTNISDTTFGPYAIIHNLYSYSLLACGIVFLLKASIKNSSLFSMQSLLIVIGIACPLVTSILGALKIMNISIYVTPITFTITILLCAISILKFKFLGVTPIALQKIVDRISDGYVVLDDSFTIIDFNQTFLNTFHLTSDSIRSKNFIGFLEIKHINKLTISKIANAIKKANSTKTTISFEQHFVDIKKYFKIEITPIYSDNNSLGTLFLLKDITQHKEDMETIKNNQDILMERERLAGLGQLIGGIAHNLKTPIMSIAGATQGLENLIHEYDESIDDPLVNSQDHHEIAKDMQSWIPKIRAHLEYMSDIITTVKGQAVASLSSDDSEIFTISELIKRVNILMKHELKNAYIYLNVLMKTDENQSIHGNVNILVQVVNNIISNAIQAYNGKHDQNIELKVFTEENNVVFSITDFAGGLPKEVQERLFKEMVTTKGKNGTGLGLYMSYSNIKAHFGGDITYDTQEGKGTTFNIIIPL